MKKIDLCGAWQAACIFSETEKNFDFVGHRKTFALISGIIIAVGVLVNLIFGVELDISFKGGTLMTLNYTGTIDEAVATDAIDSVFDNATVQFSSNDLSDTQLINISLPEKLSLEQKTAMLESLQKALPDNNVTEFKSNLVDPSMGKWFFVKCLVAVVLAGAFLTLYVALRFRRIGVYAEV